jgi:hypothetical protein
VTIEASEDDPGLFEVKSASTRLEELAAMYLFLSSGSAMVTPQGILNDEQRITLKTGYAAELKRAAQAVWHESSDSNPYPNLTAFRRPIDAT